MSEAQTPVDVPLPSALGSREVWLPFKGNPGIVVHCLSDIHVAEPRCDLGWIKRRLREIKEAGPEHRIVMHGDWADIKNKNGKSFEHGSRTPQWELDEIVPLVKPVADQIDLILPGNHEHRIMREVGLDFMAEIAARIERADAYRSGPTLMRWHFHPETNDSRVTARYTWRLTGLIHHGYGGGSNGAALNRAKLLGHTWTPEANFVAIGHVHYQTTAPQAHYIGFPPKLHNQMIVITGTAVDHANYARAAGFAPSVVGAPMIHARGIRGGDRADDRLEITASIKI